MSNDDTPDAMVELVRFPSRADADLLTPHLEENEIPNRVDSIAGEPGRKFESTISPRGNVRVMVRRRDRRRALEVLREFENERSDWLEMRSVEREPQDIELQGEGNEDEREDIREMF